MKKLSFTRHDRDAAGLTYVYPVVSRRSGGVSVGINLNPNHACNFACIYCQVPNLRRGSAPPVNLDRLKKELTDFLDEVLDGDFMQEQVPEGYRVLRDIAFSGNGEPTSSRQFAEVVELVGEVLRSFDLLRQIKLVLVTNGSYVMKPWVVQGLQRMKEWKGEIWFKLDGGSSANIRRINGVAFREEALAHRIRHAAALCPLWLQSCFFRFQGLPPKEREIHAYLTFLEQFVVGVPGVLGVQIYTVARPSLQPGGEWIAPLPPSWLEGLRERVRRLGFAVQLAP